MNEVNELFTKENVEKEVKEKNNTKLIVDSVKNIIINGKQ